MFTWTTRSVYILTTQWEQRADRSRYAATDWMEISSPRPYWQKRMAQESSIYPSLSQPDGTTSILFSATPGSIKTKAFATSNGFLFRKNFRESMQQIIPQ